jgi:threonine dehydrogenase-like Zn-dependent dehydrogenase
MAGAKVPTASGELLEGKVGGQGQLALRRVLLGLGAVGLATAAAMRLLGADGLLFPRLLNLTP